MTTRTILEVVTWGGFGVAAFPIIYNAFMEAIGSRVGVLSLKHNLILMGAGVVVGAVGVLVQVKMYY